MRKRFDPIPLLLLAIIFGTTFAKAGPLLEPESFVLGEGRRPSLSGDGNWVAYECNNRRGLCLSDTVNRTTEVLVSVSSPALIQYADISRDGMVIAYWLRPASNGSEQLFVYDRNTQSTELVSVNSDEVPGSLGGPGSVGSLYSEPHVSGNGRYVVFSSYAKNLVENDTNDYADVFRRDRLLGVTTRVSMSSTGAQGDGDSGSWGEPPRISANGNFIVFYSEAENLTPGDISDDLDPYDYTDQDAFLVNVSEGTIVRLSEKPGTSIGGDSYSEGALAISPNGRFASFQTDAENLYSGVHSGGYDLVLYSAEDQSLTHVNKPLFGAPQVDTTVENCPPDFNYAGDILYFCGNADNLVAGDSPYTDDTFAYRDGVVTRIRPLIDEVPVSVVKPSSSDLGDVIAFATDDFRVGIFRRGDLTPPILIGFGLIPASTVLQGAVLELEALTSDVNRGDTDIQGAEYALDGGNWLPMSAFDGAFDSTFERVQEFVDTSALALGVHAVCARARDAAGLVSSESCLDFEVVGSVAAEDFMVMCYHEPLWPQPGDTVTISMSVRSSSGSNNTVSVQRREIWLDNTEDPSAVEATFGFQLSQTSAALTEGSFSYGCRAKQNDTAVFSGWRTVAVGLPSAGEAIPVVYTGPSSNRIDIVFIADEDSYEGSDDPEFLDGIENMLRSVFGYYGLPVFNRHQHLMNFWLARSTGIADGYTAEGGCVLTKPADWDENYAFADVGAIIHTDRLRDCAKNGLFSTEPDSLFTARHEAGHKPFGLADEYCCDGGYFETGTFPNVYSSIEACEEDAPNLGREKEDCRSWVSTRNDNTYFSSEPSSNDLMLDNSRANAADIRRIEWLFEQTAAQGD
jgi:hypothetical protein